MKDKLLLFSVLFGGSALGALLNAQLSIRLSLRARWADFPNQRSLHSTATPRLGGLGIVSTFCIVIMIISIGNRLDFRESYWSSNPAILEGALLLAAVGFYDDIKSLNSGIKFIFQFIAAILVVISGNEWSAFQMFAPSISALALLPGTILWVVGFCNVYNFMDGINGLSGSTGIIYGISLSLFAIRHGQYNIAVMSVIVGGCCLGFLFLNFPRARTFMGDGGSLFLGFFFAVIIARLIFLGTNPIVLGLIVSVYLFDSVFTVVRRLSKRENILKAHRSHLYQRLVLADIDQKYVTLLYIFAQICTALLAFHYESASREGRILTLTSLGIAFLIFSCLVSCIEHLKVRMLPESGK